MLGIESSMELGNWNFVFTRASYSTGHIYLHEVGLVFWGLNTIILLHFCMVSWNTWQFNLEGEATACKPAKTFWQQQKCEL